MGKPRIIIADTDHNYIVPLQAKFVKEFFNKVNLEIITDADYFNELFSAPQKAEVLIVSDELYDPILRRHNISNLFLMVEQYEEGVTSELNINRLFKYTSVKEIFNEIVGISADSLNVAASNKKEPQIILVYSASGGAGKTTLSLGISWALSQNYKKVLYISADRLHAFQSRMESQTAITDTGVYAALADAGSSIYSDIKHVIRQEHFYYMPPFKAALMSLGLQYSIYEKIALSAKKSHEYDFIIVDADITFDEDKAQLLNIADKVIIVTQQTEASAFATNTLISNINGVNAEKYIFVCNNFRKDMDNALVSYGDSTKFVLNDYVQHFEGHEHMKAENFGKVEDIQKIAFLVM